eukprot:CAMPEP_0114109852 /NCGR_PEP_ID=MMETSP0043_2-20121206/997_1 /TAXON_ID=464988 /ORGANISM="Hemiselmis andersenii, Strain CCMP644" /LENGTH=2197 /DNA_ID=CAMNT_0001201757 /DNA_START=88 /DNA_END=6681 /DNA_ORIENTATION=-
MPRKSPGDVLIDEDMSDSDDSGDESSSGTGARAAQGGSRGKRASGGAGKKRKASAKKHDTWPEEDTGYHPGGSSKKPRPSQRAPRSPEAAGGGSANDKLKCPIKLREVGTVDSTDRVRNLIKREEFQAVAVTPGDKEDDSLFHSVWYLVKGNTQLLQRHELDGVDEEEGPRKLKRVVEKYRTKNVVKINFASGHALQSVYARAWEDLQAASDCLEVSFTVYTSSAEAPLVEIQAQSDTSECIYMCACLVAGVEASPEADEEEPKVFFFPLSRLSAENVLEISDGEEEAVDTSSNDEEGGVGLTGPFRWRQCAKCSTWRVPPADMLTLEGDFVCYNMMTSESKFRIGERKCEDLDIWVKAINFFEKFDDKHKELFYPRTDDKRNNDYLDLPLFFLAVQAMGGISKVKEMKLRTQIGKLVLHYENKEEKNNSRRIGWLYHRVFKKTDRSGKDLETKLLELPAVRSMIKSRQSDIKDILLPETNTAANRRRNRNQPVVELRNNLQPVKDEVLHAPKAALTFNQPAHEPFLAEDVLGLIKSGEVVVDAGLEGCKGAWTPGLERLKQALRGDGIHYNRNAVFAGDTDSGKSFFLDKSMSGSEMDRSRYMKGNRKVISESAGVQWAKKVMDNANRGTHTGGKEYVVEAYPENSEEEAKLGEYLAGKDSDGPLSVKNLEKLDKDKESAFLLPIGNISDGASTSSCAVSIKRADRYQVCLVYETTTELKQRWAMRSEGKAAERIIKERMTAAGISRQAAIEWRKGVIGKSSQISLEGCEEVEGVLDKILVFSGSGNDARADRLLMRRILHHVQGKEDEGVDANTLDADVGLHPLLDFREGVARQWGEKTSVALKRIYVHVPCQIAPSLDAELVDCPGSGDSDPVKMARMREELEGADSVIAVCKQQLGNTQLLKSDGDGLLDVENGEFKFKVMRELIGTTEDTEEQGAHMIRLAVLHNHERNRAFKRETPQHLKDKATKAFESTMDSLVFQVGEAAPHLNPTDVEERLKKQVFLARPFVNAFTEAVRDASLDTWKSRYEARQEDPGHQGDLERSGMFGVLGVIELFQLSCTWPCLDAALAVLDGDGAGATGTKGLVGELKDVLDGLRRKKTKMEDELRGNKRVDIFVDEQNKRLEIRTRFTNCAKDLLDSIRGSLEEMLDGSNFGFDSATRQRLADVVCAKVDQNTKKMSDQMLKHNIDLEPEDPLPELASRPRSILRGLKKSFGEIMPKELCLPKPNDEWVDRLLVSVLGGEREAIGTDDFEQMRQNCAEVVDKALSSLSTKFNKKLRRNDGLWAIFNGAWKDTCLKIMRDAPDAPCEHFRDRFISSRDGVEGDLLRMFRDRMRLVSKEVLFGKSVEQGGAPSGDKSLFQILRDELVGTYGANANGGRKKGSKGLLDGPLIVEAASLLTGRRHDQRMEVNAHVEFLETIIESLEQFRVSLAAAKAKLQPKAIDTRKTAEEIGEQQARRFAYQRLLESFNPETTDRVKIFNSDTPAKDRTVSREGATSDQCYDLLTLDRLRELLDHKFSVSIVTRRDMHALTKKFGFAKLSDAAWSWRSTSSADHVLTIYAKKLGHSPVDPTHKKQLRNLIRSRALESKDLQLMGFDDGHVIRYCKDMEKSFPDVRALCLLSGTSGRALNIYVPGYDRPLRFNPSFDDENGPPHADAIAYLGVKKGKPMWANLTSKGSERTDGDVAGDLVASRSFRSEENHPPALLPPPMQNGGMEEDEEGPTSDVQMADGGHQNGDVSPGYDTESEEEEENDEEAMREAVAKATCAEYGAKVFSAEDWEGPFKSPGSDYAEYKRKGDRMRMREDRFIETHKKFAQFSERFVSLQCCPLKLKARQDKGWEGNVVEDAYAQTQNMISVFDGTGAAQYWSSRFARNMASHCFKPAKRLLTNVGPGEQNRSVFIVTEAFKGAAIDTDMADTTEIQRRNENKPPSYPFRGIPENKNLHLTPRQGSSTAVVLSLVQDKLHYCECGDSLWALLRRSDASSGPFECVYVAERGHRPQESNCSNNSSNSRCRCKKCCAPIPRQLYHERYVPDDRIDDYADQFIGEHTVSGTIEVKEGDVVVAGSDGLWDNIGSSSDASLDELKTVVAGFANDAAAVAASPHAQKPLIQVLGERIVNANSVRHGGRKKPDDVTVIVAGVTFQLLHGDGSRDEVIGHHCFQKQGQNARPQCFSDVHGTGCTKFIRSKPSVPRTAY